MPANNGVSWFLGGAGLHPSTVSSKIEAVILRGPQFVVGVLATVSITISTRKMLALAGIQVSPASFVYPILVQENQPWTTGSQDPCGPCRRVVRQESAPSWNNCWHASHPLQDASATPRKPLCARVEHDCDNEVHHVEKDDGNVADEVRKPHSNRLRAPIEGKEHLSNLAHPAHLKRNPRQAARANFHSHEDHPAPTPSREVQRPVRNLTRCDLLTNPPTQVPVAKWHHLGAFCPSRDIDGQVVSASSACFAGPPRLVGKAINDRRMASPSIAA